MSQEQPEKSKDQIKQEMVTVAIELNESGEVFPFPEINPVAYETMKTDDEDCPGITMPIDEKIALMKSQGIKVMLGEGKPRNSDAFIMPAGSNDIVEHMLFPRHLEVTEGMDERLARLITISKEWKNSNI